MAIWAIKISNKIPCTALIASIQIKQLLTMLNIDKGDLTTIRNRLHSERETTTSDLQLTSNHREDSWICSRRTKPSKCKWHKILVFIDHRINMPLEPLLPPFKLEICSTVSQTWVQCLRQSLGVSQLHRQAQLLLHLLRGSLSTLETKWSKNN